MGGQADNKPKATSRKRRRFFIVAAVLAVVIGAWAIWHFVIDRPKVDMTLDLGNGVKMQFVLIPAGKFMMGSTAGEEGREANEGPQHEVEITRPFYMGVYTVTQEQYVRAMGTNPSRTQRTGNPVEMVSWKDAAEFCARLSQQTGRNVRLPTEAEWEYACRAGTTTTYNTGDTLRPDQANFVPVESGSASSAAQRFLVWIQNLFRRKPGLGLTPVGTFRPNAFGLYDMHGNVWQWCADWCGDDSYYANSARVDPQGQSEGVYRVLRGGSWACYPWDCRSAHRYGAMTPVTSLADDYTVGEAGFGFRVVVEASAPMPHRSR